MNVIPLGGMLLGEGQVSHGLLLGFRINVGLQPPVEELLVELAATQPPVWGLSGEAGFQPPIQNLATAIFYQPRVDSLMAEGDPMQPEPIDLDAKQPEIQPVVVALGAAGAVAQPPPLDVDIAQGAIQPPVLDLDAEDVP